MHDALGDAALTELREIEPGAEMLALATQHDGAHALGEIHERRVQLRDECVVEGVALGRAAQAQVQHRFAVKLAGKQWSARVGGIH